MLRGNAFCLGNLYQRLSTVQDKVLDPKWTADMDIYLCLVNPLYLYDLRSHLFFRLLYSIHTATRVAQGHKKRQKPDNRMNVSSVLAISIKSG